jgi:acyl dehydratase
MLDYHAVRNWDFGELIHTYTQRDVMLYALGIGIGTDPLHEGQLRFVFEKQLQTVPTMGSVLGTPGFWWRDPRTKADWVKIVHGEQHLRIFKPLPTAATVLARNRVISITDKGPGKGAIAVIVRELFDCDSREPLVEARNVTFLRGDGGFSQHSGVSDPPPPALPPIPDRAPDIEEELGSLAHQGLIYRLNGDYNVLHADPQVARDAGFQRPILHGLCTYGMAAHAVLRTVCDYDASKIRGVAVRFTAPVFPGETVRFQLWREGPNRVHLRARVDERDVVVLNNGLIELA